MTARFTRPAWNGWVLDRTKAAFIYEPNGYGISFDRLLTAADIAFWIFQLHHKGWNGGGVTLGLVAALDDVLDPQQNLGYTEAGIRVQADAFLAAPA